ncbi:MAG: TonB-dependent receptor, partial [Bacteroidia bacterium]|nr:TonB-dependent receptor [Bacteroidia bacterium]
MRFKFFLSIIFFSLCTFLNAQESNKSLDQKENRFRVSGTIIDENSGQYIDYATVSVHDKDDDSMILGNMSENEGYFEMEISRKKIYVEISFIGYETKRMDNIEFVQGYADLGRILLAKDAMRLEEIIVAAEKSSTEFKLDKRVFNVGKDLSSTGASALEVLNNVPSVNVSIEGEVTLRGSGGVQMLINGKPSVLANDESNALGSITADMIESIEVITNPSAKYEAEGSSGIINIVLKKNEKKGLNGSMSVNTGTPDNHSFGLSMNNRTRNFNLFTQLGIGYRELPSEKENTNTNLNSGLSIISKGTEYRNETFYNLVLG